MKLTIERAALLKALNHVQSVVERRNTIPILSNVLLEAAGGALRLKATDLDIEAVEEVPAEIAAEGTTTAPAHMCYDIVRKFPDGAQIELDTSGAMIELRTGRSRFALQTLDTADFPDLAAGDMTHSFLIAADELKRLIDKTRFAMSAEETRYYLNGIYFHPAETDGGTVLRAVATDGHRLACAELAAPKGSEGMPGVIVPRKTVEQLHKLIEDHEAEVVVDLSAAKIRFTFANVVLTSKLIDGTFPDYARVIPQANDKRLEIDSARFAEAVDRVSTISSERGRAVKLHLDGPRLVLSVNNPDSGSASEEIEVDYAGEALEIGFNARYLLDIAGQLDHHMARFDLADPGSPALVHDLEDARALYVLMPMRV